VTVHFKCRLLKVLIGDFCEVAHKKTAALGAAVQNYVFEFA
jgi:hypothetical protein